MNTEEVAEVAKQIGMKKGLEEGRKEELIAEVQNLISVLRVTTLIACFLDNRNSLNSVLYRNNNLTYLRSPLGDSCATSKQLRLHHQRFHALASSLKQFLP